MTAETMLLILNVGFWSAVGACVVALYAIVRGFDRLLQGPTLKPKPAIETAPEASESLLELPVWNCDRLNGRNKQRIGAQRKRK